MADQSQIPQLKDPIADEIISQCGIDIDLMKEVVKLAPPSSTHYSFKRDVCLYFKWDVNMYMLWTGRDWVPSSEILDLKSVSDARALVMMVDVQPSFNVKRFEMRHDTFRDSLPAVFTELNAPKWLSSINTREGSTMDGRWFWNEHVLTLDVGETVKTDFQIIKRIG